jgi:hypothetical protein
VVAVVAAEQQTDLLPSEQKVDLAAVAVADRIPEQAATAVLVEEEGLLVVKIACLQYRVQAGQEAAGVAGQEAAPVKRHQVAQAS